MAKNLNSYYHHLQYSIICLLFISLTWFPILFLYIPPSQPNSSIQPNYSYSLNVSGSLYTYKLYLFLNTQET